MNARQRISDFQKHVNSQVAAIRQAGTDAWNTINLSQTEPQIVYDFLRSTTGGTGHLNRALARLLSIGGRTVKFASIFLHQKPMVIGMSGKNTVGGKCELGDLQLLYLYISSDKSLVQCRSTIFQAKKKAAAGPYVISHNDQRRLYDQSAGFIYQSVLKGETRCFPWGKSERERALQYLFVGNLPVQARLIPSDVGKGAEIEFGETILRFLNDSTGYTVTTKPSTGKNWSRIVWDQIEHVADSAFGNQGSRNAALKRILNQFNSFEDPKEFFLEVPPSEHPEFSGGIPMLLVIVSDSELGNRKDTQIKTIQAVADQNTEPAKSSQEHVSIEVEIPVDGRQAGACQAGGDGPNMLSGNIHDLLLDLENSNDNTCEILEESERRSRFGGLLESEHRTILTVINRLHDVPPKAKIKIYALQQVLRSKLAEKIKIYRSI